MTEEEQITKKMEELANELANTKPSPQALAVADQIIHRASAALADVHAHATARITSMREQLNELEETIVLAREQSEEHMKNFMRLITEGEESIRAMELAVARIGDHLRK
jgi:TolA-binding protein